MKMINDLNYKSKNAFKPISILNPWKRKKKPKEEILA